MRDISAKERNGYVQYNVDSSPKKRNIQTRNEGERVIELFSTM
jgi:hypothetical protein